MLGCKLGMNEYQFDDIIDIDLIRRVENPPVNMHDQETSLMTSLTMSSDKFLIIHSYSSNVCTLFLHLKVKVLI